jgi:hypothetical protein
VTAIAIAIVIREACGVVETWVRRDRAIDGISVFRATHAWRSSVLPGRRETGRLRCGRRRVLARNHSRPPGDQGRPGGEPTGVIMSSANHHCTRPTSPAVQRGVVRYATGLCVGSWLVATDQMCRDVAGWRFADRRNYGAGARYQCRFDPLDEAPLVALRVGDGEFDCAEGTIAGSSTSRPAWTSLACR